MTALVAGRQARLVGASVVGLLLVALTYVVAMRTGAGQILDDWAFEGRKALRYPVRREVTRAFGRVAVGLAVVLTAAECVVAVRRRGWRLFAGVVITVGGAVASSNVLKDTLARPQLTQTLTSPSNTYPSGHMAAFTAIALVAVLISPPSRRSTVALFAAPAATAVGLIVVASGWHRPSDVVGSVALALFWCSAVALSVPADVSPAGPSPPARRVLVWTLALVLVSTVALRLPGDPRYRLWAYLIAVLGIVAAVFATVWTVVWALNPPPPPTPTPALCRTNGQGTP